MIFKTISLIILFVIGCAFSIAYHAPLDWMLKQAQLPKALSINGIQGKVWQGKAESVTWKQWQIEDAKWQLDLLPLLSKTLQAEVNGIIYNGSFKGEIIVDNETFTTSDATYGNKVENILKQFKASLVDLSGIIHFDLKQLISNLKTKQIEQLKLVSTWQQAEITSPLSLKLGQVTAKSKVVEGKIVTDISGVSGDIDISGTITISQNQNFSTKLKLRPNKALAEEVKLTLRLVGKELPSGDFLINRKGNLKYLL